MGISCPLCFSPEAFKALNQLCSILSLPLTCPLCQAKCSTLDDLHLHIQNNHSDGCSIQKDTELLNSCHVQALPDSIEQFLQDFDEVREKLSIKDEAVSSSTASNFPNTIVVKPPLTDDLDFESFQKAIFENSETKVALNQIEKSLVQKATLKNEISVPTKPTEITVQCKLCGWNFDNENFLQLHLVLMHSSRRNFEPKTSLKDYKCRSCNNIKFSCFEEYVKHVREVHKDFRYICKFCTRTFKLRGSLLVHHRVMHTTPSIVQSHLALNKKEPNSENSEENSEKTNMTCPHCKKCFKKESHLNQHMKVHESKLWECEVCNKSFTTKYFLKKHKRLHTGETPYACDICGKHFTFQQSYHKHMLYHTDEKPYSCSQCGRPFKELSTLQNHERIHTGERPFACETCGKSFRQRVSYLVHRRIHTGSMPYFCEACGKSFRYKVTQRTHKCPLRKPNNSSLPDLPQNINNNRLSSQKVQDPEPNALTGPDLIVGGQLQCLKISESPVLQDQSFDTLSNPELLF